MNHNFSDNYANLDIGEISEGPKNWLIAMGSCISALGVLTLITAVVTTALSVALVGTLFVFAALFQAVYAVTSGYWRGFGLHLSLAVLYGVTGFLLIGNPILGSEALTLMLGLLFFTTGVARILGSLTLKFNSWGWALFSGAVTTVLGVWTLANFPLVSPVLIGTVIGVDLIFAGAALIALGFSLKSPQQVRGKDRTMKAA